MAVEHQVGESPPNRFADFSAPAVVRDESQQIGLKEATIRLSEGDLGFDIDDNRFDLPLDGITDVGYASPPDSIADRFEKAVRVSGETADGDRCLALVVGDADDMSGFAGAVMASRLEGVPVIVEQTVVPTHVDGRSPTTRTMDADLGIDPTNRYVAFDAGDLEPIEVRTVTGIEQVDTEIEDETRSAVKIRHLAADRRITTLVSSRTDAGSIDLFLSHLVNASRADGRSGPIRVLFVDDEPGLVSIAAEFLERAYRDMDVKTATSVAGAISSLDDANVECVVSDYAMDDGDGLDLLQDLRDRDVALPFVLFTRKTEEEVGNLPSDITAYFQKEMGTDQYQKLATLIERTVAEHRSR